MEAQALTEEKSYRLSRSGRRMAYLLLAGGVLIWLFALWTLKNTLRIGIRNFGESMVRLGNRLIGIPEPLTAEELIPAIIMLVLVLVVPLLIWNLIEELRASYTVGPAGITFRSVGLALTYPWEEVAELRPVDEEAEEPLDELVVRTSRLATIPNVLVRFLHWQAYGRRRLPLYGGLEERDDLIARIRAYMAASGEAVPGAPAEVVPPETVPAEAAGTPAEPPSVPEGSGGNVSTAGEDNSSTAEETARGS